MTDASVNLVHIMIYSKNVQLMLNLPNDPSIPQNERFEIHGRMYDAMSIDEIALILTDEETGKSIDTLFREEFKC